jgi:hypothetical protein
MSFEDDAYWESEYTDRSSTRSSARSSAGSDVSRRPAGPDAPVDELAVRRKRRQGRYRRPPRRDGAEQKGFDTERPSWLDDPDFVPTDVSAPDAGHDSAVLDFNRPELGGAFDAPVAGRWTGHGVPDVGPRVAPRLDDDWDDEIDEPYDHRAGMDRRSTVRGLDGYVPSPEDRDDPSPEHWDDPSSEHWDDPSSEDWDEADADEPAAGLDDPLDLYRRVRHDGEPEEPSGAHSGPRVVGRAAGPAHHQPGRTPAAAGADRSAARAARSQRAGAGSLHHHSGRRHGACLSRVGHRVGFLAGRRHRARPSGIGCRPGLARRRHRAGLTRIGGSAGPIAGRRDRAGLTGIGGHSGLAIRHRAGLTGIRGHAGSIAGPGAPARAAGRAGGPRRPGDPGRSVARAR